MRWLGATDPTGLRPVTHHNHGIHAGVVRCYGNAPEGIFWELGARSDAKPLLKLRGDVYLE